MSLVFLSLFYLCTSALPTCMSVPHVCVWCLWRPEGGVNSSGIEVTDGWEPPCRLETEPGSSGRAAKSLNRRLLLSTPHSVVTVAIYQRLPLLSTPGISSRFLLSLCFHRSGLSMPSLSLEMYVSPPALSNIPSPHAALPEPTFSDPYLGSHLPIPPALTHSNPKLSTTGLHMLLSRSSEASCFLGFLFSTSS